MTDSILPETLLEPPRTLSRLAELTRKPLDQQVNAMHSNLMQPDRYLPALIIDTVKLEQQDVQVERLNAPRLNYLGAGDRINPKEQPALDGVRERGRTADMIVKLAGTAPKRGKSNLLLE
jgi:hypothetical protein